MTKKVAVINDLSGFGRCSLTAAISVIAAMGVQPCPLPTAILSGQTGYPSYYCDDYTEKMDAIRKEWKESNALLGGTNFIFWTKIGIPILMPSILSTFSVLFANALAAYASAYALLMNNVSLLPIRLSEQFVGDLVQRPEFGSAIAVVLIAFMIVAILIQNKLTLKKGI